MKLNLKRTSKVGLAFAIIILFWNTYDFVVPLLIEDAFGLSNAGRGVVMGLDNLLSLFMLPFFGKLSDKSTNPKGRRTPFIVFGTICSVALMIFIPITAKKQLTEAEVVRNNVDTQFAEDAAFRIEQFDKWYTMAENGDHTYISKVDFKLMTESDPAEGQRLTKSEFATLNYTNLSSEKDGFMGFFGETTYYLDDVEITKETYDTMKEATADENTLYTKFADPGIEIYRTEQVYAITEAHKGRLVLYLVVLLLVLIAMGTFRSPAVALMPDVTPKPLRSQANAIINLAGGIGGAISFLIYTIVLSINPTGYMAVYFLVAGCMLLLLFLFTRLVNEPAFVSAKMAECEEYGILEDELPDEELQKANPDDTVGLTDEQLLKLQKAKKRSFLLILASIFMWFMGYNAVSSNLSIYTTKGLSLSPGTAGLISGISMGISAIAFIPVGALAVKIGRRKSIMLGFTLAIVSFALIWLVLQPTASAKMILFTLFYLIAGFGLIIANVNTFPMVVELSAAGEVGKYTGYYYMATMSAQAITPAIAGVFMDAISLKALFPYAVVCIVISVVLMVFVKHGDSKPLPKAKKKEEPAASETVA